MDSVEDEMAFPPPAEPSPPQHHRRLKRLKKVSAVTDVPIPQPPVTGPALAFPRSEEQEGVDPPGGGVIPDPGRSAGGVPPAPRSDGLDEGADLDDGLDPLFGDSYRFEDSGAAPLGDETEMQASEGFGRGDHGVSAFGEAVEKKKSAKKRLSMEAGEGKSRKKRMSSGEGGRDGKAEESARNKRKLEKERKVYLERLHAESQRLLRETRDASFKPATVVEKPISSVLEKIRQRKLEILKISTVSNGTTDLLAEANSPVFEPAIAENDRRQYTESIEAPGGISGNEDQIPNSDAQETQEASDDYQHCNKENYPPEDYNDELQDNNGESPLFAANLNANSDPSDDTSSDEEDYDKENVDPCPDKPVNVNLYRKNDLAKSFVDEEAEEEDGSDHDLMRFQENDEEEENEEDEDEVLDDLIATGYEEMPLDNEKRNELHQKWLQQQDAALTDNVLQRLNCGKKQRDPSLIHDEKDDEEPEENCSQESLNDAVPVNAIRQHSRKAKQMIAQMFTDAEDAYVSSDDEETEQRLFRHRLLLEQAEERSSLVSPVEDEPSREVFGLIRKLNTAADPRKKARPSTASLDMLVMGGSKSNSFKPSFLGRTTNHSMPSSKKHASSTARSFIFGRDDSNSRSSFSSSENNSDVSQQEPPKRNATAKFCSSQPKFVGPKRKIEAESSGASLFEILRRTSIHFDQQLQISNHSGSNLISGTQAARQFTAFKLSRKTSKKLVQEA